MSPDNFSLFPDDSDSYVLPDIVLSDKVINWLTELYDVTDWRCVVMSGNIDREYDGLPISNYLKALALPYLMNIPPSERWLGQFILKRSKLQKLCGFRGYPVKKDGSTNASNEPAIGSRTFWHFRNKYKEIYSELITKVLISLVLSGKYPNLKLPFVEKIREDEFNNDGNLIRWEIDAYRPIITISIPWTEKDLLTEKDRERFEEFEEWKEQWRLKFAQSQNWDEYRRLKNKYDEELKGFSRRIPKGFTEEVVFPVDVSTTLISGEKLFFRLKNPDWLNKNANVVQTSTFIGEETKTPASKSKYDKACNVLVIRQEQGEKEILLSRRKREGIGEGSFAAPGGKQKEGESLEKCAKRELEEETGLILIKSKPVSIYYTRKDYMGGKQIMSIGALAESWSGEVETKEPSKHTGWQWYKLNDLPSPIFEFTEKAISQFLENKYPNLTWEDLEEKPDVQLSMFDNQSG